jgi:hypothetical protein
MPHVTRRQTALAVVMVLSLALGCERDEPRLEQLLTNKLADAMEHQVRYAVDKIRDVRFDGERLEFYWIDGSRTRLFTDSPSSDKAAAETFRPEDAKQFVAAFRAKKARGVRR